MNKQPEALRLADTFDHPLPPEWSDMRSASVELRRLHAENEALRATLDQQKVKSGGIPPNCKLVPVDPTEKMIDMGRGLSSFPGGVYRAMLAAAPQLPAVEQSQVQASAIPAGWKLVPSDATHQWAENLADRGMRISSLASAISDMLAAAPHPPTTEQSSVVYPTQVEQEPVTCLADAIRAEPTELIHKWRVLELIQDHARQQPKREPLLPKY